MIDDERPDAPEEGKAPEESGEAPQESGEAPEEAQAPADAPNEGAPGDVDPAEVQDAEPSAEPPPEPDAPNEGATGEAEQAERPRRERRGRDGEEKKEDEVVPGAHLEPDLVLEQPEAEADEYAQYAETEAEAGPGDGEVAIEAEPAPAARTPLELAADARYQATGKRKTSVARVILRPGDGAYTVNGRSLEDYFPRAALQKAARQPLQTAGFEKRMDVVAKIHGGGISAQAGALRHGVARALVEADPSLRVELKRRGYLSRDARAKERKKAGLKKARKRPQFSKR